MAEGLHIGEGMVFFPLTYGMDDLAYKHPDGLVLLPKAGDWSPSKLKQQQDLANQAQAAKHAGAQIQNLTFDAGVHRLSDCLSGMVDDWTAGKRSLSQLVLTDNRLQGLGLWLVLFAMGGLIIDVVLVRREGGLL